MPDRMLIFPFLFLMLGPFKIIGPFAKMTQGADPALIRQLAIRSIIFSSIALLIAALLGEMIINKYGIPLPILGISGGIILFLVALLNVIQQFAPIDVREKNVVTPTLNMAMNPLAFPTIVTPYGIAAVIVILAYSTDLNSRLTVGATVVGIMLLNLFVMLITRHVFKFLAIFLAILGAILAVIQVALGLLIINNQLRILLKL
jgi:multiple antibiotic resistance protein